MRKLTYLIITVTAVSLSAGSVFADKMKGGMMEGGKDGKGREKGMMKMMHKMHGMMRSPTMVASNDGGVIVLTGNKLYKYDKNLTLVKEAEIKMEMADRLSPKGDLWPEGDGGMMGGMGGKKKMCCQGKKMMGQDTTDDAAEGEAVEPAQENPAYESHH